MAEYLRYLRELLSGGRDILEKKYNLLFKSFASVGQTKEPVIPPPDCCRRFTNFAKNNFRGVIGVLVPLLLFPWGFERFSLSSKAETLWKVMFWFFLWQPVAIPVVGLIPIFFLPMTGTMSTNATCASYMNENVMLYLLAGMLLLLLSNAKADRRLAFWFLCSGHACQHSANRLIFKVCMAAFFMSMFCNRLLVTSMLTQYMTAAMNHIKDFSKDDGNDYDELRYILNSAIHTSASIGSIAIMHSSYTSLLFRAIWHESPHKYDSYPDIFNYMQYSAFAFPVALTAATFNYVYYIFLSGFMLKSDMGLPVLIEIQKTLQKYKSDDVPFRYTAHEKFAVVFTLFYLLTFFFRFSFLTSGWADFSMDHHSPLIVRVRDATCAAMFVVLLHSLPRSYRFLTYIDAATRSELPPIKPESAILWWRYVDMNTNYGFMIIFGAAIALQNAIRESGLDIILSEHFGATITNLSWNSGVFWVCFIGAALSNMMPSIAACTIFCPFVCSMCVGAVAPWPVKSYIPALGVGIATAFGFCFPFKYTPAYFCYHTGKVPRKRIFVYGLFSVLICVITLWLFLIYYAAYLFDPNDEGVVVVSAPLSNGGTTTGSGETSELAV